MLDEAEVFGSFAVTDIRRAKEFYGGTLGLRVSDARLGQLRLHVGTGRGYLLYPKPDHTPATFTVLNFIVDDIDEAVGRLVERGVRFEHYDYPKTDADGIDRAELVAWFTDPDGNILSVVQER
jgi:catechol 2,3-dioxygenase-like lactoylglutathione lyase family enzyme